jgi:serine/threonine protein phosphatase PrpC
MSSEKTKNLELISVNFLSAAGSHPGLKRDNNEDRFVLDASGGFFLVVDGMGGHAGGEVAAQIAVETIQTAIRKIENSAEIRLRDSIILANNAIYEKSREDESLSGMGCVLTALLIENEIATIAHVGDTRLYKIKNGEIQKLTTDHSPIGEIEESGDFSEIGLMRHPRRNEVSRCLGLFEIDFENSEFVDVFETLFLPETAFLLCSDGLSDLLTSGKIFEIIVENPESPADVVENLIAEANNAGGKDNITVVFAAGSRFSQTVGETENASFRQTSKTQKLIALFLNRWAFLFYGLLLGGALVFLYFYKVLSVEINLLPS